MTNKTQIMRHEFERTNGRDHRRQPPKGNNYTDPMAQADWESFQKGWSQALAVPAEDVRAVVEEPVAWAVTWADDGDFYKLIRDKERAHKFLVDSDFAVLPLYHHPQRPVVMPERVDPEFFDSIRATGIGWNACLDEFARLNPEI